MKSIIFLVLCVAIISCNSDNNRFSKHKEYAFDELTVNFIRNTRVTTFLKEGEPISGTVTQELRNGGKNIWDVEKGLAIKQTLYYPNGQMRRIMELKNGVEHGTFVVFYSDGQKYLEQFYEDGTPTGTWHRWNREGEIVETVEY